LLSICYIARPDPAFSLEKKHKKTIFQDEGFCTGIEFGGEQMLVLDKDDQQTIHIKNDE
jgi:hypothetical protein